MTTDSTNTTTSLNPSDIVGLWGVRFHNTEPYIAANRWQVVNITTDDGVQRLGYPYDPQGGGFDPDPSTPGIELWDRPESEYTYPMDIVGGYTFTADGKYYFYGKVESATRSAGYQLVEAIRSGTYTIEGDIVTLTPYQSVGKIYNDQQDYLKVAEEDFTPKKLRVQKDPNLNRLKIIELDAQGQPIPENPDGVDMDYAGEAPTNFNLNEGIAKQGVGTIRDDLLGGSKGYDLLQGREGNDRIAGNGGLDSVVGGAGSDRFYLENNADSKDIIGDFNPNEDFIFVRAADFNGLAPNAFISADQFTTGTGATTANQRIIYNQNTGELFYDADGSGGGAQVQIATLLSNPTLGAERIYAYQDENAGPTNPSNPNPTNPNNPNPNNPTNPNTGTPGNDSMNGGTGNDSMTGGAGNDSMTGGAGNDSMTGGIGDDQLLGGIGDDGIFGGEGIDLVNGNQGNDAINGNQGNDIVRGGKGDDLVRGGKDNDMVYGDLGNDNVFGDNGEDTVTGGGGNDSVTGGMGSDRFLFDTNAVFSADSMGVDILTDFVAGTDKIVLDQTTFTALTNSAIGVLQASNFAVVSTDANAAVSGALIVYNSATGGLFYNQNGAAEGFGTGAQFARLTGNPVVSASDFIVQA